MLDIELSIIIINWHSKEYLRECLRSIFADDQRPSVEVIVVDNASYDGCDQELMNEFPDIRFVQAKQNLGFAKANNLGFYQAKAEYLLFLNPDTEVRPGALREMLENLQRLCTAGVVGAHLLNHDGSVQTSCVRVFPTIQNQLLDTDFLRKYFPNSALWGTKTLFEPGNVPKQVDAVSGACLMIKRSVFEDVSMFSTDYFMYSEDIDLCLKVQRAGWKTYYIPNAVVVHHGGGSSGKLSGSTFSSVMMLESRWRFFRKTQSVWYSRGYRLAMFSSSLIRVSLLLFMWPVLSRRRKAHILESVINKWKGVLRWTLGREKWVKSY